jgi:hypothetical protein
MHCQLPGRDRRTVRELCAFFSDSFCPWMATPNRRTRKENRMSGLRALRSSICALAAVVTLASIAPVYAQTQGMERRDERRDTRAGARAAKQACKAGDEKTRPECRQMKRSTKQHGRQGTNAPAQPPPQ